jgi:hypothetical protein
LYLDEVEESDAEDEGEPDGGDDEPSGQEDEKCGVVTCKLATAFKNFF